MWSLNHSTLHLTSQQGLWCSYQQGQDIFPQGPDIPGELGRQSRMFTSHHLKVHVADRATYFPVHHNLQEETCFRYKWCTIWFKFIEIHTLVLIQHLNTAWLKTDFTIFFLTHNTSCYCWRDVAGKVNKSPKVSFVQAHSSLLFQGMYSVSWKGTELQSGTKDSNSPVDITLTYL